MIWYLTLLFTSFFEGLPLFGSVVPGATLAVFGGFLAKKHVLDFSYLLVVTTLGAYLGDFLGFWLGRRYGFGIFRKYGKYIFLTEARLDKVKSLVSNHPAKSVVLGRFNSLTRSISSYVAGASGITPKVFFPLAFLSSLLWALSHILVGFIFGRWIERIIKHIGIIFFLSFLLAVILIYLFKFINLRHHAFKKFHVYTLTLSIFSLFFFSATLDGVVRNDWMQDFDQLMSGFVKTIASPWLTKVMIFVTHLGDPLNVFLLFSILALILVFYKKYHALVLATLSLVVGTFLQLLTKSITNIPRPSFSLVETFYSSFPSGHATTITILCSLLIIIFLPEFKKNSHKYVFFFANVTIMLLVGFSRVYLRAHFASDVVAGISLGIFSVCISVLFLKFVVFVKKWLY